eukprot:2244212-Ditylum_brightwellii.AAC.1
MSQSSKARKVDDSIMDSDKRDASKSIASHNHKVVHFFTVAQITRKLPVTRMRVQNPQFLFLLKVLHPRGSATTMGLKISHNVSR